ncbi:OpgC domain-containing protein [Ferrovibrio sp.]|uniref:OpgC family protein n=1 Tax=Ferrovibrio sp. TaxID=1917215 RepID=UPI0025C587A5|nr:OpgC domain-containing protein [Ferrovibrio sp.]
MKPVRSPEPATPPRSAPLSAGVKPERDLRLDFFRGLSLLFIFLNHIPNNVVSWISNRNYGFSDATEIFVFISGYSVMLAYGGLPARSGYVVTFARVWKRVWQIYTAHIFLFMIFITHIAYVSSRFNPVFAEEMGIADLFDAPHILLLQAIILRFKPANMDVLPLYIALLFVFPFLLPILQRWPNRLLAASLLLWAVVQRTHWNFPAHPEGGWFFNPLAWQFLFLLGAWCALKRHEAPWRKLPKRPTLAIAALYLIFSFAIVATWHYPPWGAYVPDWLKLILYPVDKTEQDVLRLLHFLCLAYGIALLVKPQAAWFDWRIARPIILCGRHSLHVFCAGIFLSFAAQFILVEFHPGYAMQFAVSFGGIALLIGLAELMTWYKKAETVPPSSRSGSSMPTKAAE